MSDDPFDRRFLQERLFQDMGNLIPVPIGFPKETTGLRVDIGNRTWRNFKRFARLAEEGIDRGYDESFRRTVSPQEMAVRAAGLQPEEQRRFFQFQKDFMATAKSGAFDRDSLLDQMAIAVNKDEWDKFDSLQDVGLASGVIIEGEIADPGFMQKLLSRKILEQEVSFAQRALLRSPEMILSPGLKERFERYLEE
jgi:hypothetical protein